MARCTPPSVGPGLKLSPRSPPNPGAPALATPCHAVPPTLLRTSASANRPTTIAFAPWSGNCTALPAPKPPAPPFRTALSPHLPASPQPPWTSKRRRSSSLPTVSCPPAPNSPALRAASTPPSPWPKSSRPAATPGPSTDCSLSSASPRASLPRSSATASSTPTPITISIAATHPPRQSAASAPVSAFACAASASPPATRTRQPSGRWSP